MASVLSSWKEIANHLGKGVRTVQRWERELGLPVHRPDHKSRNIVFAFPDELNTWIKTNRIGVGRLDDTSPAEFLRRINELEMENAMLREELGSRVQLPPLNPEAKRPTN